MEQVSVNTVYIGSTGGLGHFADLLPGQPTVAIAVTGRYDDAQAAKGESLPTTFITLLSAADTQPLPCLGADDSAFAQARGAAARRLEDFLLAHRARGAAGAVAPCPRYQRFLAFRDRLPSSRLALVPLRARSQDHFCDGHCASLHPPAPPTFPGDGRWTFASGAAGFDAARLDGRRPAQVGASLAPERRPPPPPAPLERLGAEVERARGCGLRDVWVMVVAAEPMSLAPRSWAVYEMQTLVGRCVAEAQAWAPPGQVVFAWRAVGEERRLCVRGGVFWLEKPSPVGGADDVGVDSCRTA